MKLLFTWMLGVPALVLAMVVARAMTPQGLQSDVSRTAAVSLCAGQLDLNDVGPLVAKDGHRAACNARAVQ